MTRGEPIGARYLVSSVASRSPKDVTSPDSAESVVDAVRSLQKANLVCIQPSKCAIWSVHARI